MNEAGSSSGKLNSPPASKETERKGKRGGGGGRSTMRFGSIAKVLLKCKLKYYRISE